MYIPDEADRLGPAEEGDLDKAGGEGLAEHGAGRLVVACGSPELQAPD